MRWTASLIYVSALLLVAATVGRLFGWTGALEAWLLLLWTVSLLPVAYALYRHPMRTPAWGLFIGFWGSLAILLLIVFQALGVASVMRGSTLTYAESWPLAVIALWILLTSLLGLALSGDERDMPPLIDAGGILTGAALFAGSFAIWISWGAAIRPLFLLTAIAYVLWTVGMTSAIWDWGRPAPRRQAAAEPEPAALPAPATP